MTEALWLRINTIESFAADVAHELKNPLTSLRSAIEMAGHPNLDAERRAKLMGIVMDDINRLNRLISDISDASRLDAELMRGEVRPVELDKLLRDMVHHYAVTANQKSGVEVEYRVAANPPFVAHGHDGRYGQVFRNVIDNAISFSPKGSKIIVELGREPRNGPFVVTIDDEGQGIPEDNLESIFQRFYSERPTEHFGQHSGLGLSICRQIVETLRRHDCGEQQARAGWQGPGRALHGAVALGQRTEVTVTVKTYVHATCVALQASGRQWRGVLLRGPSGAGKSDLALRLIDAGAKLVADARPPVQARAPSPRAPFIAAPPARSRA